MNRVCRACFRYRFYKKVAYLIVLSAILDFTVIILTINHPICLLFSFKMFFFGNSFLFFYLQQGQIWWTVRQLTTQIMATKAGRRTPTCPTTHVHCPHCLNTVHQRAPQRFLMSSRWWKKSSWDRDSFLTHRARAWCLHSSLNISPTSSSSLTLRKAQPSPKLLAMEWVPFTSTFLFIHLAQDLFHLYIVSSYCISLKSFF